METKEYYSDNLVEDVYNNLLEKIPDFSQGNKNTKGIMVHTLINYVYQILNSEENYNYSAEEFVFATNLIVPYIFNKYIKLIEMNTSLKYATYITVDTIYKMSCLVKDLIKNGTSKESIIIKAKECADNTYDIRTDELLNKNFALPSCKYVAILISCIMLVLSALYVNFNFSAQHTSDCKYLFRILCACVFFSFGLFSSKKFLTIDKNKTIRIYKDTKKKIDDILEVNYEDIKDFKIVKEHLIFDKLILISKTGETSELFYNLGSKKNLYKIEKLIIENYPDFECVDKFMQDKGFNKFLRTGK